MKPETRLTFIRLVLPLAAIFALSVFGFVMVYMQADSERRLELEAEVAKGMVTLMAGVIISGILVVIVRDYEARRKTLHEEQEALRKRHRELRSTLLGDVSSLYREIKSLRRELRAKITNGRQIDASDYVEALKELSNIQLSFEACVGLAKTGVRENAVAESVPALLKSMERFLGRVVTEYEQSKPSQETLALDTIPLLEDYIGRYRQSRFRSDFVEPYHAATETLLMASDPLNSPLTNR